MVLKADRLSFPLVPIPYQKVCSFCSVGDGEGEGEGTEGSKGAEGSDEEAEGSEEGKGTPPTVPVVVSQEQLNRMMADNRRQLTKQNQELQEKLGEVLEQNKELSVRVDELSTKIDPPEPVAVEDQDKPEYLRGEIERLETQHKQQIDDLKTELVSEKTAREEAEYRRLETERDRQLTDALQAAGCIDLEAGRRIFLPQVERDGDAEGWTYKTKVGEFTSITDGIAEELPDYLKPPVMPGGGSGSRTGSPSKKKRQGELDSAEEKLRKAEEAARGGRQSDQLAYLRQKRIVEGLRATSAQEK